MVRYDGNYASGKTPLSKRAARYAEKTVSHAGSAATTTLPYAEETTEWRYEGASAVGVVQTVETPTLNAGFVTKAVRETRAGHGATGDGDGGPDWGAGQSHTPTGVQRTTRRTLSFDNDATGWVLGFAGDIEVEHYGGDAGDAGATPDWTETVRRTQVAGTLAPDVVTRFPNDDAESGDDTETGDNSEPDDDFEHRTDYDYDSDGNRKKASETASGSTRIWEVQGFAADRFPTSWKNPLKHTESATHHVGLGVPATTTDANGRRMSYAYDGLGREVSRTRHWDSATTTNEDGEKETAPVTTTTSYAACDAESCPAVEGDGGRLRRPLFGVPGHEGDDLGAGHPGLDGLPGHVRARHSHVRRGLRRRRPASGRVPRRARPDGMRERAPPRGRDGEVHALRLRHPRPAGARDQAGRG